MARPSALPPEEKARLVLSVLPGELSIAEAARKARCLSSRCRTGSASSSRPAAKASSTAASPVRTAVSGRCSPSWRR